jgi:hypothetical protein
VVNKSGTKAKAVGEEVIKEAGVVVFRAHK